MTIDQLAEAIDAFDGVDPLSGVALIIPGEAYAVYADNYALDIADFPDWRGEAEDSYQGEYDSDEDFAQSMADDLGYMPSNDWPYTCIDWGQAARELMFDYWQTRGHYFAN